MASEMDKVIVNQRYERDCGVACVATITDLSWEKVFTSWPGGFHGDVSDSYIHHQEVLGRLNHAWSRLTFEQLVNGHGTPGRTALLINALDDPETWNREDLFNMHWCVFASRDHDNKRIFVHWLNGFEKVFGYETLRKHFSNPFCVIYTAYPISKPKDLPWYKRLYTRITSWFNQELY